MGLKVGEVKLEKWTPKWRRDFEMEKQNLLDFFGPLALDIQHIGSTSVEYLDAKPIIDIAVELENLADFEKVREIFAQLPQYSVKLDSEPGEILIRKGPESNRTHFIHVMESESQRMKDSLKFRDILRCNPRIRNEYYELKYSLANKYPNDRKSYTAHKSAFIKQVLEDNRAI